MKHGRATPRFWFFVRSTATIPPTSGRRCSERFRDTWGNKKAPGAARRVIDLQSPGARRKSPLRFYPPRC